MQTLQLIRLINSMALAVTCLTAMTNTVSVIPADPTTLLNSSTLKGYFPFSAIKLGLLPNVEVADLALDYVKAHAEIPGTRS